MHGSCISAGPDSERPTFFFTASGTRSWRLVASDTMQWISKPRFLPNGSANSVLFTLPTQALSTEDSTVAFNRDLDLRHSKMDENPSQKLIFQAQDEALDDGNRAVVADRTKPWVDAVRATPIAIFALKLRALVADQVSRTRARRCNCPLEQATNILCAGLL